LSDTHDDLPHSEELAADIAEAEAGLDDGLGPIDALIAERDQWKDRALRAAAEAENVRRRTEGQMNDARAYAIQRFARDLLGVADVGGVLVGGASLTAQSLLAIAADV
jgi:molecular chaperone GrpE